MDQGLPSQKGPLLQTLAFVIQQRRHAACRTELTKGEKTDKLRAEWTAGDKSVHKVTRADNKYYPWHQKILKCAKTSAIQLDNPTANR